MKQPETTTVFAGIDGRTTTDLPAWYRTQTEPTDVISFAEAIRSLPRATQTPVAYQNPFTEEWIETDRFNAIVEPSRLMQQANDEDKHDPLFHVPSNAYAIINPTDVYAPLEDVLHETELDGHRLGDVLFGEIRQYRGGGEVHMDLMFDGLEVTLPERREPITMGVTTGYDFFGGRAVYVEGFARDTYCANSIRALTDREAVKHVGDVGDFGEWWTDILTQLELVANDLFGFIEGALDITIDVTETPFDVEAFYELLGFPSYLAQHASGDAAANATDVFEPDMWTLHSGATHALTHFYRGKEGTSLEQYVRLANDILFNPDRTIERVREAYEREVDEERDGDQRGVGEASGLAQIERIGSDVKAKAEQFEAREEVLKERFAAVDD
jgi:hypothetical protein